MEEKTITMPVSKLSYSSLTQLLRNPIIFKMKHILGVYDTKMGVSGMIGRAGHEALKLYYGGNKDVPVSADRAQAKHEAMDFGLQYLGAQNDAYIDYGKTGSREAMLKAYTQAMQFYFAEEPEYHKILLVEEKMTTEAKTKDGDILPLPITGASDLVNQFSDNEEDIEIIDTKFVTSFTSYETEDYIKIVQAMFMYHLLRGATGKIAKRMIFREIKRTANADGSPQIRDWAIPFDHEPYFIIFYNLFKDVVKFLSNDPVFLPNLSDMFDGEQAGLIYAQGLINADMSDVEVMHKVREVAFTSKKFVTSRLDIVENKNLLPEEKIKVRLAEFGIPVEPIDSIVGASVTQYRFKVSAGVRMSTILKHKADIALAIEAKGDINILAPIPGTAYIGVEVENKVRTAVKLDDTHFIQNTLSLPIGVDVNGKPVFSPLNEMPHLLVAGTTGSGKSVTINSFITALTKQNTPDMLKLILIDPKRVELKGFAKLPHVEGGVLYEYRDVTLKLLSLVEEMERRYSLLEKADKRDIAEFNKSKRDASKKLPYIVVVIDEFADFMIRADVEAGKYRTPGYASKSKQWLCKELGKRKGIDKEAAMNKWLGATKMELIEALQELDEDDEMKRDDANVELLIVRLAQMARAVGIHLIIATQRPSVDVITGLIKANFPTRIALTTASPTDSNIILGQPGAEKLSGKGDMLFMSPGAKGLQRLQGFQV